MSQQNHWDEKPALKLAAALKVPGTAIYIVAAGAGTSAVNWLFREPGASTVVAEALVPSSQQAVNRFLGVKSLPSYASRDAATALAIKAQQRCAKLTAEQQPGAKALGVACAAAINTHPPRRGADRAHIACHDGTAGTTYSITFIEGAHTRRDQERVASMLILHALACSMGAGAHALPIKLDPGETVAEGAF